MKILPLANWILITGWVGCILYGLMNRTPYDDAGGRTMETGLIVLMVFAFILMAVLNLLPYQWTKIACLLTGLLLLLLVGYIRSH